MLVVVLPPFNKGLLETLRVFEMIAVHYIVKMLISLQSRAA